MNLPALCNPVSQRAFPILDVESLMRHLPASQRAELAWTVPLVKTALSRLCNEQLTDDLLRQASLEVARPLYNVMGVVWRTLLTSRDEWRAVVMDSLHVERIRMREFLTTEEACETLEWVFGYLRSLFDFFLAVIPTDALPQLHESQIRLAESEPFFLAFATAQATLMAAVQGSKTGVSVARAVELLNVSFLEFVKVRKELQRSQIWISPFPHETVAERREQLLVSVDRLRQALTETDWQTIDDARMGDLR